MGLTTQYLRYVPSSMFGAICSGCSICFVTRFCQKGKYVAVPACEKVFIWDMRKGSKVLTLDAEIHGEAIVLTARPPAPGTLDNTHIAVGYSTGSIAVFDLHVGQPLTFAGHRSPVTAVAWDQQGMRVASGSSDGEIVLWDVVSERGIVRLRGHKGKITQLHFFKDRNVIASSCVDSFIKFWDLDTKHCFKTLTGHRAEVWDFVLLKKDTRLISGSSDAELRVWALEFVDSQLDSGPVIQVKCEEGTEEPPAKLARLAPEADSEKDEPMENEASNLKIKALGSILRSRGDRVCGIKSDGRIVACYGKGSVVDLFSVLSDDEVKTRVAKRLKRARKRSREGDNVAENPEATLSDEVCKIQPVKMKYKVSSSDVWIDNGVIKLVVMHNNNSIGIYKSSVDNKHEKAQQQNQESNLVTSLCHPGHRSEIHAVAFNSIGDQVVTASGEALKVWHRADNQAVLTAACDSALSLVLVPGDRHALIGTRSGRLQLFDLGSSLMLEDIVAHELHEGQADVGIRSIALTHDGRGFVSGGSDCMVKLWKFELVRNEESGSGKRLSFIQDSRALKVADQVTCIRCSNNGKYVAVATLDLKETLYFMDTLKLCHELYGKSMPATCMDFACDSMMIVTGSKDSCIRIFGTDFGDQRRLFKNAHQGGVTDVRFVPKTHHFFSCGHDGTVKQWDGDNFEHILTLQGHGGIVRCLAVCPKGAWVVSCGHNYSVRLWERTQEPLILEEEREQERQQGEEDEGLATQRPVVAGEEGAQAVRPMLTTFRTEKAADMILEALQIYEDQINSGPEVKPHEIMVYVYKTSNPLKFVLEVLQKVRSSELEEALLVLPFDRVVGLLAVLRGFLLKGWNVELSTRILILLVRANLPELLGSSKATQIILSLAGLLRRRTRQLSDMVGFNLAGLQFMKDRLDLCAETQFFVEAVNRLKEGKKKRKKKEKVLKRALIAL